MLATSVSEATLVPVYTAKAVSKREPRVLNFTMPFAGAVHSYQTEAPSAAGLGSSSSMVALTFVPPWPCRPVR